MAALQKLTDEFLTCIICQSVFKDPATLHCGHTFCGGCITSYVLNRPEIQADRSIPCPHCRGLTKVPDPHKPVEEWASQLKTGFFVKGLVETFVAEDTVKDDALCSVCKEAGQATPADKWCADCNEALCSKCLQMHTQYPKFREHKTAELAEGLKLRQSAQKHICQEHKDEQLKLFCKDCDKAICHLCCSVNHRKCDSVIALSEFFPQMKQDLSGKVVDMQFAIVKHESILSERKSQLSKLIESCGKAFCDVDSTCDVFIKNVLEKQEQVKKNIEEQKEQALELLTTDMEMAESVCKQMELNIATLQNAVQSGTEFELYEVYKTHCSKNTPGSLTSQLKEQASTPRVIEINFKSSSYTLTSFLHTMTIGNLDLKYDQTKKVETEINTKRSANYIEGGAYGGKDNLSLKSSFAGQNTTAPLGTDTRTDLVLVDHIEAKFNADQNEPHVEDIITVPDGDSVIILLTDIQNKRLKAFYRSNGKKISQAFSHPPCGLTQMSDNIIAVTVRLAYTIYLFQVRPDLKFLSMIKTKVGYTRICSLDGDRFAATCGDKTIDILDNSGTVTKRLESDNISNPIIYKMNNRGQILVCDPDTHTVQRMTINDKTLFKYNPYGKHRLVNAVGAGMDYKGNIYVVNRGCNKVVMLNGAGKFVKTVLSMDDSVEKLAYIAFDKSNRMYLTYEDNLVCIYQL